MPGTDTDPEQGWYTLVRSSGASAKGAGAGGSFGLGKYAPFAASQLHTVFYSTRLPDDSCAFQGVTRLVTHEGPDVKRQPTGFLGGTDGRSVRKVKDIPKIFRRDKPGTDVFVLGYHTEGAEWQGEIILSVVENFWPAIVRSDLEVNVGDVTVGKANLVDLLNAHATADKDFDAHRYHLAYIDQQPSALKVSTLPILGEVKTWFLTGDPNFRNRVAMVRKTGMVVYHRVGRSRMPYCGVFECRNDTGNAILQRMEPPRHDEWSENLPEKGDNRKAKKELEAHILDRIRQLAPVSTEKVLPIPDLNQYLPDDGDTPEEAFDGPAVSGVGTSESFDRTPKPQKIQAQQMKRKPADVSGGSTADEGDDEAGGNSGGDPNDGDGGNKGSQGGDEVEGATGGNDGGTPVDVRSRAFVTDAIGCKYSIIVHPPNPRPKGDVLLAVAAVGDDAKAVPVQVSSARVAGGKKLTLPALGRVGPVSFPKTAPLRLEVELTEPRRLSLQITAMEVSPDAPE